MMIPYRSISFVLFAGGVLLTVWLALLQGTAVVEAQNIPENIVILIVEVETADIRLPYMRGATAVQQRATQIDLAQHRVSVRLPDQATVQHQFESFPYTAVAVPSDQVDQLKGVAGVKAVFANHTFYPMLDASVFAIGADVAWDTGYDGAGQTVVVIDTGIDRENEFFGGRVVNEACFSNALGVPTTTTSLCPNGEPSQFGIGAADPINTICVDGYQSHCNHGTHVAGIAVGKDGLSIRDEVLNGIATGADVIGIQVFSMLTNTSVTAYSIDMLQSLDYVYTTLQYSHTIAAVNMSLGGGAYTDQAVCDSDLAFLKTPIDALRESGIATIIASGNDQYTDTISAPACISSAVAVGASVTDIGISIVSNSDEMVELLAPGDDINSSVVYGEWPYMRFRGTSMAAPHVAGAWALAREMSPTISVTDALNIFIATGLPISDTRPNGQHIKPLIQIDAAITQLAPPPELAVSRTAVSQTIAASQIATQTIEISNVGGLPLVWQAAACDDSPAWLALSATETITTMRNAPTTLDLVFDVSDDATRMAETTICLSSNAGDTAEITASLTVMNYSYFPIIWQD